MYMKSNLDKILFYNKFVKLYLENKYSTIRKKRREKITLSYAL